LISFLKSSRIFRQNMKASLNFKGDDMKKMLVVLVGMCCLGAFSSVSMAAPVKATGKGAQASLEGQAKGVGNSVPESARKKVGKNIKRSSEHGSVRGSLNGGGDFI